MTVSFQKFYMPCTDFLGVKQFKTKYGIECSNMQFFNIIQTVPLKHKTQSVGWLNYDIYAHSAYTKTKTFKGPFKNTYTRFNFLV